MATGREGRAARLNERLRGAQRANVEDESFSLDIAGLVLDAPPAPVEPQAARSSTKKSRADRLTERLRGAQRIPAGDGSFSIDVPDTAQQVPSGPAEGQTPRSTAKRRRSNNDEEAAAVEERPSSGRRSTRSARKDPYELSDTSKNSAAQSNTDPSVNVPEVETEPAITSSTRTTRSRRSNPSSEPVAPYEPDEDALETLPAPGSFQSPVQRRISRTNGEEIEESPADAPGSGKTRIVRSGDVAQSSARLQEALHTDDAVPPSSSPLVRKKRQSDAASLARSTQLNKSLRESDAHKSVDEELDELSPNRPREQPTSNQRLSQISIIDPPLAESVSDGQDQPEEEDQTQASEEEAEEIGVEEAAQKIGAKRMRRSPRTRSPELGSSILEADKDEERQPKRRRRQQPPSPAAQKQPATKPKKASTKPKDKQEPKSKKVPKPRQQSEDADNATIEITVQRFMNNRKGGGDDDLEGLQTEIPFANRSDESVVDVFAQVCEEVTTTVLAHFQEVASNAADAAKKKESRIKIRAVEAYRQELSSRLLEHTLHLNHWHSLRKRVRHVQKEKLALREEILRLKAEREQVALQMDEIRIKHETDTKEAKYRLDTSSLMHDIDLAVAQGQEAPELSRAEQKEADLANLELLVSRVVDEASSTSNTGGLLNQVRDFNAFLERAAIAFETK